tara:strand:- start:571 stop:984 length:414 start_codon:yes stop_codon:yes gene_type:complete
MTEKNSIDWIDHYGFILVAFAHMTDWYLADSELQVISEKLDFMISSTNQPYDPERVAQKLVKTINRYKAITDDKGKMDALIHSCSSLKDESWFDNLASALLLDNLAEIAEADHKIEETENQFLKSIADIFGVNSPRL